MTACVLHRWSPWRPVNGGLLERRCPCGSVERGTVEVLLAALLAEAAPAATVLVVTARTPTRKKGDAA